MNTEKHALLALDPAIHERVGAAIDAFGELAERVRSLVVDIRRLAPASGSEIALDQVVRRVVVARDLDLGRAPAMVGLADGRHRALPAACLLLRRLREFDGAVGQQIEHARLAAGDRRHMRRTGLVE